LNGEHTAALTRFWQDGSTEALKNDSLVLSQPFKLTVLQDFLKNPALINRLMADIENLEWSRRQMDLYEYFQSHDLACETGSSALKEFYDFLSVDVMPWMREVTGLQLTHISASCSMYTTGDHLLVHDDMLADRRIAFIFYISPDRKQWTSEMGGALELFEADEEGQPKYPAVGQVMPRNNQLVFFKGK
jgi:prolyl 3-hydroxylase /prolyl 3,4-dihydroxylase